MLKAAVKVAVGVKYPTLHFTAHCHTSAKIQMLRKNKRVINCYSPNLAKVEAVTRYKFLQTRAIFSCFNHRWLWSNFSSASEGRFLLKRGNLQRRRRLASRSCSAATLILWNACTGQRGSEIAKALPSLLKGELPANCMHMALGKQHQTQSPHFPFKRH